MSKHIYITKNILESIYFELTLNMKAFELKRYWGKEGEVFSCNLLDYMGFPHLSEVEYKNKKFKMYDFCDSEFGAQAGVINWWMYKNNVDEVFDKLFKPSDIGYPHLQYCREKNLQRRDVISSADKLLPFVNQMFKVRNLDLIPETDKDYFWSLYNEQRNTDISYPEIPFLNNSDNAWSALQMTMNRYLIKRCSHKESEYKDIPEGELF